MGSVDEEIFEITDFTCVTDWERFVGDLESRIRDWQLHDEGSTAVGEAGDRKKRADDDHGKVGSLLSQIRGCQQFLSSDRSQSQARPFRRTPAIRRSDRTQDIVHLPSLITAHIAFQITFLGASYETTDEVAERWRIIEALVRPSFRSRPPRPEYRFRA